MPTQSQHYDRATYGCSYPSTWMSLGAMPWIASASLRTFEFKYTLTDIPHPRYRLADCLELQVEKEESSPYVVSWAETGVFSYHEDIGEALDQFYEVLVNEFEFLAQNEVRLSSSLQRDLETFRRFLVPRY